MKLRWVKRKHITEIKEGHKELNFKLVLQYLVVSTWVDVADKWVDVPIEEEE